MHVSSRRLTRLTLQILASINLSVDSLERYVSLDVADSAQKVTMLEGSLRVQDEEFADEPTTFVADCDSYKQLPCTCAHVRFDEDSDGSFKYSFDRLWNRPSLEQMLTVQALYYRESHSLKHMGPYFWHTSGFGLFKNSLDAGFVISNSYSQHFPNQCHILSLCRLTMIFGVIMNWLIHVKQFALFPLEASEPQMRGMVEHLFHTSVTEGWMMVNWESLVRKPAWAEAFIYVASELEHLLESNPASSVKNNNVTERFRLTLQRMGADPESCLGPSRWPLFFHHAGHAHRLPLDAKVGMVSDAVRIAFDAGCQFHPARRLVIFAAALRPFLPKRDHQAWPPSMGVARPVEGAWVWRLCGDKELVHRRVGQVELHFLAADLLFIGGAPFLELLWMATSDDSCVMAGTNFHNTGNSYYSFAHTLPASHLVHWRCSIQHPHEQPTSSWYNGATPTEGTDTSSVSFSGFLTVTACPVAPALASALLTQNEDEIPSSFEVSLTSEKWTPEPFRVCPAPRPVKRRVISACTSTLHSADYVHRILPHAIEDWINYHVLIGIQHFTLFDTDGSYEPYVQKFVQKGLVRYHGRFPSSISPKLGLLSAGLANATEKRSVLLEPHAIEKCMWENRHVSDWVLVLHSFEEYLHSPVLVEAAGQFNFANALKLWAIELRQQDVKIKSIAAFELLQEPMGGPTRPHRPKSVFSAWTWKRGLDIHGVAKEQGMSAAQTHAQTFTFIADPLNALQSAVHFVQSRANDQNIVIMPQEFLHMKHYVDFGSNATRCLDELGGCRIKDESMMWAEEKVIKMRRRNAGRSQDAERKLALDIAGTAGSTLA